MRKYEQLPPWQEITYFDAPKITTIDLSSGVGAWNLVVGANPQRVAMILSFGQVCRFSPDPTISTVAGLQCSQYLPNVVIREAETGNLCAQAWYASPSTAGTVTAIEILLRQWPDEGER